MNGKFRVWDKVNKYFIDPSYCYINANGILYGLLPFGRIEKPFLFDSKMTILNEEKYIKQFFTGVQDKNSKDMYDGDIINVQVGDMHLATAVVIWSYESCGFVMKCIYPIKDSIKLLCTRPHLIEIIGNIFETPELLEKK